MTSVKGSLPPLNTSDTATALTSICVPSVTTHTPLGQMSSSTHRSSSFNTTNTAHNSSHHLLPPQSQASQPQQQQQQPPPPPPPAPPTVNRGRLPLIAHPHPVMLFEGPPGSLIPLPLPPPPYSTLPSRCNQRRFFDQVINFNNALAAGGGTGGGCATTPSSNNHNGNGNASLPTGSNSHSTLINSSCLPSYHHLYSSVSPASLRRQQRRIRREQRSINDNCNESPLTENKKYLIFVSLLVIGILLMFVGIVTLSLFTISFGFTFILFALLLYKLLPSSKYPPRIGDHRRSPMTLASAVRGHHAYMITPNADCVTVTGYPVSLPPPPPSYQEAVTSGQIIEPLDVTHLIRDTTDNNNLNVSSHNLSQNTHSSNHSSSNQLINSRSGQDNGRNYYNNTDTTGFHGYSPGEVTVVTARTDSVTVTSTCSPAKSAAIVKVQCNDSVADARVNCNSNQSSNTFVTSSSNNSTSNQSSTVTIGNSSNLHQMTQSQRTSNDDISGNNRLHFITIIEATI